MGKKGKLFLKILISTGLFYFIFRSVDIGEVKSNISLMDTSYIPLIILLLVLNYIVSSYRWKLLLIFENCSHVSVKYLISLYFKGAFFNNFMPTSIGGDVYKIIKLGNKIESKSNAFTATFMERFTGVLALVLISYLGFFQNIELVVGLLPAYFNYDTWRFLVQFMATFGFWAGILVGFLFLKIAAKKVSSLSKIYTSLVAYKNERTVLVLVFLTSFIVQFLAIFTQYFIFLSLGAEIPLMYALFVLPIITLASFVIPSLNGLGVQDELYRIFFSVANSFVSGPIAISSSLIYHFSRLAVSLFGGVLYAFDKDN